MLEALLSVDAKTRVMLVHPYQRPFEIRQLAFREGVAYCRFEGYQLGLEALHAQCNHRFATMENRVVILDECDRATEAGLTALVAELLNDDPMVKIAILSNTTHPYLQATFGEIVVTSPSDPSRLLPGFGLIDESHPHLEVRALGSGRIWVNSREIRGWEGSIPKLLFLYSVDKGITLRNEVFAHFWPDLTLREATNVFHVTKRKINEMLGYDLIVHNSGYYALSSQVTVSYDVRELMQITQQLEAGMLGASEASSRLIDLYRLDFLSPYDTTWCIERRVSIRHYYAEALALCADKFALEDNPRQAIRLYRLALLYASGSTEWRTRLELLVNQVAGASDSGRLMRA